jgi:hypothetical protein
MKMLNFKRALGLVAIGGAAAYIHKKYGFRNLAENVREKLAGPKKEGAIDVTPRGATAPEPRSPGMPGSRVGVTPPRP